MTELKRYFNKVVLITGAANGVGRSAAERFAQEGAKIILADRNYKKAKTFAIALSTEGHEAKAFNFDAESIKSCDELVRFARNEFGRIDILVNNVGGTDAIKDSDILNLDISYFDKIFHVNIRCMMYLSKLVLPSMIKQGKGVIINISGNSSDMADNLYTLYGTTKAGVQSFTRHLATQYAKFGIRCNAVSPGLVLTNKVKSFLPDNTKQMFAKFDMEHLVGEPEEVANTIVFLASNDARFINGQTIKVDGGLSCNTLLMDNVIERYKLAMEHDPSYHSAQTISVDFED
ncbi:MAG: SDR family NAD(P)-dependent oxidoreductase [Bacteroidales bacterium]